MTGDSFYPGLTIGIFFGCAAALLILGLCFAAKEADEITQIELEKIRERGL